MIRSTNVIEMRLSAESETSYSQNPCHSSRYSNVTSRICLKRFGSIVYACKKQESSGFSMTTKADSKSIEDNKISGVQYKRGW